MVGYLGPARTRTGRDLSNNGKYKTQLFDPIAVLLEDNLVSSNVLHRYISFHSIEITTIATYCVVFS